MKPEKEDMQVRTRGNINRQNRIHATRIARAIGQQLVGSVFCLQASRFGSLQE